MLYYGWTNNGVRTVIGESAIAIFERRIMIASKSNWDNAWSQLPKDGPIATFIPDRSLSPSNIGYVTGTYSELERWIDGRKLLVSTYGSSNFVPFSNGLYEEESQYALSDEQFKELFGFDRPADALSTPARRMPAEIAFNLPPFAVWGEGDYAGLRIPQFLQEAIPAAS